MSNNGNILLVDGTTARELLSFDMGKKIILETYLLHEEGNTVLPPSIFLRPDSRNRIIGLAATIGGERNVSGIKWVSSYPENYLQGIPRASSMIILNNAQTGYPFCCINGSFINLFRTSCSAFIVFEKLLLSKTVNSFGIVGTGAIASCFIDCIKHFRTVVVNKIKVFDKKVEQSEKFIQEKNLLNASIANSAGQVIKECDAILFATTAGEPYICDKEIFNHNPLVLHISLRDLSAEIILASNNIVDDADHVNRENTSIHLANKKTGNLNFINGTIAKILQNKFHIDDNKPTVLSPFGLGILDVAIGKYIYDKAAEQNKGTVINNFFN